MKLSHYQRESVTQKKTAAGWLYDGTPPHGFNLNGKGLAVISSSLVSDIQANTRNTKFNSTSGLVPLSPVPVPYTTCHGNGLGARN